MTTTTEREHYEQRWIRQGRIDEIHEIIASLRSALGRDPTGILLYKEAALTKARRIVDLIEEAPGR